MSDTVDLGEFRTAYLVEAEDLLAAAGRHVLQLEAALKRGQNDLRAVRELFRAMHTIKGLSAMVGVEPVVAIAHRLEHTLRSADKTGLRLDLATVDRLVEGIRAIHQRVGSVAEGKPVQEAPQALLAALDGRVVNTSSEAPEIDRLDVHPELAAKLGGPERQHIAASLGAGMHLAQIDFVPTHERAAKGQNITTVREVLSREGEIVKVVPRTVAAAGGTGLSFAILLATRKPADALASAASVELECVKLLGARPPPPREPEPEIALPRDDDDEPLVNLSSIVRVDVARLDESMEHLSAMIVTRARLSRAIARLAEEGVNVRELRAIAVDNARQLRDLRSSILRLRMVPMAEVLDRVPLLVRAVARATEKQVKLVVDAGSTEVDKGVAERIFPAIVHLVRNAVDHAVETPGERRRAGKPEAGRLSLVCAERASNQLEVVIEDDGRGVDAALVAKRAGREVPETDAELLDLLCIPGLSTREEVSTTSGRGMGMDIVRRTIDQLGGELHLETRAGAGTRFTLRLPLTISIQDAFTFECGGERFAVPIAVVDEIIEVDDAKRVAAPGAGTRYAGLIERRGEALPLVPVCNLVGGDSRAAKKAFVIRRSGESIAFAVDRLLGQQEVVVRPLEDPLVRVSGVTGATDLGDGRPTLVLDLHALMGAAQA